MTTFYRMVVTFFLLTYARHLCAGYDYTVSFATCVWEREWKTVLLDPNYIKISQVERHSFPFCEKLLVINNVDNLEKVLSAANHLIRQGVLTQVIVADEVEDVIWKHFHLDPIKFSFVIGGLSCDCC